MNVEMLELKHRKVTMDMTALLDKVDKEGRGLDATEEKSFADWQKEETSLAGQIEKLKKSDEFSDKLAEMFGEQKGGEKGSRIVVSRFGETKSIGAQFTEDAGFKAWLQDPRHRSGAWASPIVECKATLTEDPASGGNLVVPQYLPNIVPLPLPAPAVIDLFAPGQTGSNTVIYMKEKTYTNAAAPVLEGTDKPESTLTFEQTADAVRKLAHWLPASEEILDDVPGLMSYIDARLRLGVRVKFNDQLLNGTGVAPQLLGVLNRLGLSPAIVRTDPQTNADAILLQIAALTVATQIPPDAIVMHPNNWTASLLLKTSTGEYLAGSPFAPLQRPTLWGLPVAITPAIAAGTALVGSFRGAAQLFMRGPLAVKMSNSHADFFIKNLVAIVAEQRAALCVFVEAAFGKVTGLTAAP